MQQLFNSINRSYCAQMIIVNRHGCVRIDVLEIPTERLALKILSQLETFGQIARLDFAQLGYNLVKVANVLVGPDVDHATIVLVDDLLRAAWELVRGVLAEHVTHVRAGRDEQSATAHPDLLRPFNGGNLKNEFKLS